MENIELLKQLTEQVNKLDKITKEQLEVTGTLVEQHSKQDHLIKLLCRYIELLDNELDEKKLTNSLEIYKVRELIIKAKLDLYKNI